MSGFFLGLDYGTGGAKGCIIDKQGKVLGYSFEEYPIITPRPGWSEHDPVRYWQIACSIIKSCLLQAKIPPSGIKAIAVSSALPCMVMVDIEGNPLNNAYNLMDRRATEQVQWIKDKIGEQRVFEITGNRLDDHPSLVNVLWEKKNRPDTYNKIHKVVTIEGYIVYKLTGKFTLSNQNAVFMGVAYNLVEKRFEVDVLNQIGIDPAILPDLHYCDEIAGEVNNRAAQETGLIPGIPVAVGQADFNAACIASGVIQEGDIQCNLGTCGNFGVIHKSTNFMYEMIALGFTVGSRDTYITIPTTTTGGMSIRYLRDSISQAELESERILGVDAYDLMNLQAQKVPVGSEGLIVLPFLMGERTPIWDVNARGCIFGLSLNHKKGHIIRATMEGVAYAMYDSFRLIKESGMIINLPIVMHEGGAKSVLWRKIITDLFDTPTVLTKHRTGAPFGDAVLAGVAVGAFKDYSMCKEWAEYIDIMEPDKRNHETYLEFFDLYKELYNDVKDDYRKLANLRNKFFNY
jgi:ribulokinase